MKQGRTSAATKAYEAFYEYLIGKNWREQTLPWLKNEHTRKGAWKAAADAAIAWHLKYVKNRGTEQTYEQIRAEISRTTSI